MSVPAEDAAGYGDEADNFVAVVGMAGRFPESPNLEAFWDNLRTGTDCLHTFSDEEIAELGIPLETVQVDNFVRRGSRLPDRDGFDARFFGYTPKQAARTDPQARIFLETCYEALENAGYNPFEPGCPVGVFAGSNPNDYALLMGVADPTDSLGAFDQMIGVDRDFLATRVSHKLGLTGPAMTVQTACSTSLVTVHVAVQSLLAYECSMALAGGVSVNLRQGIGYFYQPGMILSPTGECRAFDARAEGTTLGQGCGAVLLKRLPDALADRDHILAVIRATAVNNDGRNKIGYTAPSEDGQVEVISMAHSLAGIESDSIGYIETHGTGTLLGDPIEIAALTRAFKAGTSRRQYCAIGSAKTNFGHTDAAAGITGFIKAVLTLYHGEIPPSIHFDEPNPAIDFANSPFFVNTELQPFPSGPTPRRAGVSAFGIGGTNAHVVLEEASPTQRSISPKPQSPSEPQARVLVVSARSSAAADRRAADLNAALADAESVDLSAVDFTLRHGRPLFDHRRAVVVESTIAGDDHAEAADGTVVGGTATDLQSSNGIEAGVIWLFAGQGAQYPGMGADLYNREPVFRESIDRVAEHLRGSLGLDLRSVINPPPDTDPAAAADRLRQTAMTQPALFAVEYALTNMLGSWGQRPRAVIGHSIGEYAAAVEAGILSWSDAADLVVERGRLMQSMEPGLMLSASVAADKLRSLLPDGAELATDNSTAMSVASGPTDVIKKLLVDLEAAGVSAQILHTSHAFHSAMMDDAAARFADAFATVTLSPPTIPLISNVTGRLITDTEAVDPSFWASQIRQPVRFTECLATAANDGPAAFLELGPGRALSTFASANEAVAAATAGRVLAVPTMRHPRQSRNDQHVLLEAMGRLWSAGHKVEWDRVNGQPDARRVPLPTYPFERIEAWQPTHRHVLALPHFGPPTAEAGKARREPLDRWLYAPSWQRQPAGDRLVADGITVVLAPAGASGDRLIAGLEVAGVEVIALRPDTNSANETGINRDAAVISFLADLAEREVTVANVVQAWSSAPAAPFESLTELERRLDDGVHATLACARGLSALSRRHPVRLDIVTAGAFSVTGTETIHPDATALLGPTRVIPLEYSGLTTRLIDVADGLVTEADCDAVVSELISTIPNRPADEVVALRYGQRWVPTVAVRPTSAASPASLLRDGGRYLIVGGLGGVGLSIADHLAREYRASIVLTGRRGYPIPTSDDDQETVRRLELLDEIERVATDLQVKAVDATDEAAMVALIEELDADGQPLDGVIVAAGVADRAGAIHRRDRDEMIASMASKIQGLVVLERALGDRKVDFVLLSSSIATTLYHNRFAQVGYVTGNAFAEAFALRSRQRGQNVITVAWDDWLDVGMSVRAARDFTVDFGTDVDLVDEMNSFSPAEGVMLFDRALRAGEPILLVSPTDLVRRIEDDVHVVSPFLQQAMTNDTDGEHSADSAATPTQLVTSVWSALLGFDQFEPTDDFFELGGDSLQAARMVDRLSRAFGMDVPVDLVFDNSTLSRLAEALDDLTAGVEQSVSEQESERERPAGPLPLGPAQLRFLDRGTEHPDHFNVSVLLRPKHSLDHEQARRAVASVRAHDALHLSIATDANGGGVHQRIRPDGPDDQSGVDILDVIDLSNMSTDEAMAELERSATEVQTSLDLKRGPVLRCVLYELPGDEQRLLVTIHHLISDRISLLLIMDAIDVELQPAADGAENGQRLSPSSSSFLDWVGALAKAATSNNVELSRPWLNRSWSRVSPLPVDHKPGPDGNRNSHASAVVVDISADDMAGATTNGRPEARSDERALLALASAISRWSGNDVSLIDVMGHGRRLPLGIDVSRAVGMFITYSPALIDQGTGEQTLALLRADIEHGWSFDALRYHGPDDVRVTFAALPRAQVLFNYVGQSIATAGDAVLVPTDEPRGPEVDPEGRRDHPLAVRVDAKDDGGLRLIFVYSELIHDRSTIENLARDTANQLIAVNAET